MYAQFVSIDADFRMKRKDVSSDEADSGLNAGCAYFVEEKSYKTWLKGHKGEVQEVRVASRINDIAQANDCSEK